MRENALWYVGCHTVAIFLRSHLASTKKIDLWSKTELSIYRRFSGKQEWYTIDKPSQGAGQHSLREPNDYTYLKVTSLSLEYAVKHKNNIYI